MNGKPLAEIVHERDFLARRFLRDEWDLNHDEVGVSSNAMLREALGGTPVAEGEYPHDLADLARCLRTMQLVPAHLRTSCWDIVRRYVVHLGERYKG